MKEIRKLLKKAKLIAEAKETFRIQKPEDAVSLFLYDLGELEQEELWILLLNARNEVVGKEQVYKGSLNCSAIRVGEVFRKAVRENAAALIAVHNHPSGDPSPSPEDASLTKALFDAGKLLDIELLDHLIIGKGIYVSMKSKGLGFR